MHGGRGKRALDKGLTKKTFYGGDNADLIREKLEIELTRYKKVIETSIAQVRSGLAHDSDLDNIQERLVKISDDHFATIVDTVANQLSSSKTVAGILRDSHGHYHSLMVGVYSKMSKLIEGFIALQRESRNGAAAGGPAAPAAVAPETPVAKPMSMDSPESAPVSVVGTPGVLFSQKKGEPLDLSALSLGPSALPAAGLGAGSSRS